MKTCLYCAEEIQEKAILCKHCGRHQSAIHEEHSPIPLPNPGVAAVLNLFLPGCGYIIGRIGRGIFLFFGVVIGCLLFIIPGFIIHIITIVSVYDAAIKMSQKT